jgi:hypothetical protein
MTVKRTLFAAAIATLLWVAYPTPASAATHSPGPSSVATHGSPSAGLLGGTCWTGVYSPTSGNGAITLNAFVQCWSSIDFAYINMHLQRIQGGFDNGVPGSSATCMTTTSWDLGCTSSVPCVSGYYYGVAEFQASSTSGYTESETWTTPGVQITC